MENMIIHFDLTSLQTVPDHNVLSDLRVELAIKFDRVLKENRAGKWIGGKTAAGMIQILLRVDEHRRALSYINAALDGHWLSTCMNVQYL